MRPTLTDPAHVMNEGDMEGLTGISSNYVLGLWVGSFLTHWGVVVDGYRVEIKS